MNVLLIEDDKDTQIAMIGMLEDAGMKVTATGLGEEGVSLAKNHHYDIILLDINLPDMHGYKVLEALGLNKNQTPVTVVSGMSGIEDKNRALSFGAQDYITKPFREDELIARIDSVLKRSKGQEASIIEKTETPVATEFGRQGAKNQKNGIVRTLKAKVVDRERRL